MIATKEASLFQNYFNTSYSYNELLGEDGNLRPHWQTFFNSFEKLGPAEIQERRQDILRFLKENGVTYNIYGDPSGLNRPWNLDLIPFLVSKPEWSIIEAGLVQRAELFNLILKDIYGSQQLIKNGLLPIELVYNHPGFLRQCAGIPLTGNHHLILYSADIARSPDGKVWVLNDRTQAPSGSGYALENRMAMARILPELFEGLKVKQLTPYFNDLRDALTAMAPTQKQPRVVILTPGPRNETYFEHSYLSSYLGYTLVQGDDLMVKDSIVWLKTIGGLEKVDVILRRVDDVYCDPLELKEDSHLGVAGLLQAVRSRNVTIANPLGSGILENPGIMPFLPAIAKYYFQKPLILPNIASWWCGQPKEMKYVLENIPTLIIKRIYRDSDTSTSIDGSTLNAKRIQDLKEQIKTHPYLFVGQEKVSFSSTPSLSDKKVEPRNALFRSFLVSNNDTYTVMKGGLTRTASDAGNMVISNQLGGFSKDTWIINPDGEAQTGMQFQGGGGAQFQSMGGWQGQAGAFSQSQMQSPIEMQGGQAAALQIPTLKNILPSHTAENLFWVGRYAERFLGNARFQRTVMQVITEGNRLQFDSDRETEQTLLMALTHYTCTYPGFVGDTGKAKLENPWKELSSMMFDISRSGGLMYNFTLFSRSVNAVRDHWSTDTWRVLRSMEEHWAEAESVHLTHFKMMAMLDDLITSMVAFIGLNRESISREQGWVILDTGRKIEQSLLLVNMLRATLVNKHDEQVSYNLQEAILKSNESLVNYRYKYKIHLQLPYVLELMLLDANNPRSLVYQVFRIKKYLESLPKPQNNNGNMPEYLRLITDVYDQLKAADKNTLLALGKNEATYEKLDIFLSDMFTLLACIPNAISKTYFKHTQTQRQLFTADKIA
ncbi:circularly permuted type 2 ATP-grasp protein [Parasediminibacterium sp. JCM 36343]|uniref:circularly permuted type 2 ATP-grasp protein n=1 Tax=Parasediminibacterium sp. JCM 36343 TaxID=3374279 RepID=UPI003979B34C